MARSSLAELIAELEAGFRAMPEGVRALLGPLHPMASAFAPEAHLTQFGEYERVEESKFSPPALPAPEPELPEAYGRTRLVLLVAGPYRVHAYWEVTPESMARAAAKIEGLAEPYRAVLRFYDAGDRAPTGSFDVEVDLQARNWYVDFWSADMNCRADLGLRGNDGRFVELARSNPVRTPRAWPKPELQEHFVLVEPVRSVEPAPAPPYVKPRPERPAPPVEPQPPPFAEPALAFASAAGEEGGEAPPSSSVLTSAEAVEVLQRKLTELGQHRQWDGEPPQGEPQPPGATQPPVEAPHSARGIVAPGDAPAGDLTGIAEQQFVAGFSSASSQRKHAEE
jgi:hypothetical protein